MAETPEGDASVAGQTCYTRSHMTKACSFKTALSFE